MDLQWLQDSGGIVPQVPVTKEVSWTHLNPEGDEVTDTFSVRVKRLTVGELERLWAEAGKNPGRSHSATMLSETVILGDEGEERLSYEQAFRLDPTLADALLADAVNPVNPLRRGKSAKN